MKKQGLLLMMTIFLGGCSEEVPLPYLEIEPPVAEPIVPEPVWTISEMAELFGVTVEQVERLIEIREWEAEQPDVPTFLTVEEAENWAVSVEGSYLEYYIHLLSEKLVRFIEIPSDNPTYCIQADLEGCAIHPLETAIAILMEKWYELTGKEAFG